MHLNCYTCALYQKRFILLKVTRSSVQWAGIVEFFPECIPQIVTHPTRWKNQITEEIINVVDGEAIVAMDPGEIFDTYENSRKVLNCLGGKWIPQIRKQEGVINCPH